MSQPVQHFPSGPLPQLQLHLREPVLEGPQSPRKQIGGDLAHIADNERPDLPASRPPGLVGRPVELIEDDPCRPEEGPPGVGQADDVVGPIDKFDAEIPLELPDLATERRLGHVQSLGRSPEVKLLGHDHEVPQMPDLDYGPPPISARRAHT